MTVATFFKNRLIDLRLLWLDIQTELRRRHDFRHPDSVEEIDVPSLRQDPGDPYP